MSQLPPTVCPFTGDIRHSPCQCWNRIETQPLLQTNQQKKDVWWRLRCRSILITNQSSSSLGFRFPRWAAFGSGLPRSSHSCWTLPFTSQKPVRKQEEEWSGARAGNSNSALCLCGCVCKCIKYWVVLLSQASDIIVNALNQNLVEFELKPGIRVIVYNTQLTLGKKHLPSLLLKFWICPFFCPLLHFCSFLMPSQK